MIRCSVLIRLGCCIAAASVLAQSPFRSVLTGTVIDQELGTPIGEAKIEIRKVDPGPQLNLAAESPILSGLSDASGKFRFEMPEPGKYMVQASRSDYAAGGAATGTVDISADEPASVELALSALAGIFGTVTDWDTKEPVPGFPVVVINTRYSAGHRRMTFGKGTADTDENGQFAVEDLRAGNYVVHVAPPTSFFQSRLVTDFGPEDIDRVDQAYDMSYWPGGYDLDAALPVQIMPRSRAVVDARVRRVPYYRVHVSNNDESCAEGEMLKVVEYQGDGLINQTNSMGQVPCEQEFLVRGLEPRPYHLLFSTIPERPSETKRWGRMDFTITDHNLNLDLLLSPGVDIRGRVQGGQELHPDLDRISVQLQVLGGTNIPPMPLSSEGTFTFPNMPDTRFLVRFKGLPSGYVITDVKPGTMVSENRFWLDRRGDVDVVIDEAAGSVSGVVESGGSIVAHPLIGLLLWPPDQDQPYLSLMRTTGDEEGRYRFTGLAPGDYRIFALTETDGKQIDRPGVLESLLGRAKTIEMTRGSDLTLSLDALRPI